MWQDWALLAGQWIFLVTLIPILADSRSAVPRLTSVLTAAGLFGVSAVYFTMGLDKASGTTFGLAVVWSFIAWKRPVRTFSSLQPFYHGNADRFSERAPVFYWGHVKRDPRDQRHYVPGYVKPWDPTLTDSQYRACVLGEFPRDGCEL